MSRLCAKGPRWAGLRLEYIETSLVPGSMGAVQDLGVTGAGLAFESATMDLGPRSSWVDLALGSIGVRYHCGGPGM